MKQHHYQVNTHWTGNIGFGTAHYKAYDRAHAVQVAQKPVIQLSFDPSFLGDPSKYNPEELFLAALSSCHMLWYLHLCASNGVIVLEYQDKGTGTMLELADGSGSFIEVILYPEVVVTTTEMIGLAQELHQEAHKKCFIANSCNFPLLHQASISITQIG